MKEIMNSIPSVLEKHPRIMFLKVPAIIHALPSLSSSLGYNIYILRDDLTGFALGGNKTRKLEYLIGDALAKKANTLVTMKASSFSRNAAAAGKVYGFEIHVVLDGNEHEQNPQSQALFKQYNTNLHYSSKGKENALLDTYNNLVESLKKQGKIVYELHPGGSDSIGALGYINAFQEILKFSQNSDIHFSNIILATGSTGTQVGLLLGQCISKYDTNILGFAVSQKYDVKKRLHELTLSTAKMLHLDFDERRIVIDDKFFGPGYAIPSEEGKNALKLFAEQEGILLDNVYTAKAAAGLIYYATNKILQGNNLLFIHTGGNAGLFY